MTSSTSLVLVVGWLGLLGASVSRRWAQRVTRCDALLHRLRGDAAADQHLMSMDGGHAWRWRGWVLMTPLTVALPGVTAGVGAFSLVVGMASSTGWVLVRWAVRGRDPARYERALMGSLDSLARQLRSGASLRAGLVQVTDEVIGPLRGDLQMLQASMDRGELFSVALHRWAERRPMPAVVRVVGGLGVGHDSGALRARHVEALADGLRQDQQVQREAASWAAQAQASALIMVVSPLAFSMLLATGDPTVRNFLVHSPLGLTCLSAGLALDLAAAAVMAHMVAVVR